MTQDEKILLRETTNLLKSEKLLRTPPEEMRDEEALAAWSVLDLIDKEIIKARKDDLREHLLRLAETCGQRTSKGHMEYQPAGSDGTITKQRKSGQVKLNTAALEAVLAKRGFDVEKITTRVIDEAKVEALIALGAISPEEVRACSSIGLDTYALVVKKPSEVLALMPKALKGKKS